ncbi:hypothetical protein K491DRAFT_675456 [Lophiostoma macrostomum CBS 122681]|uniref:Uncharacterized protein n=1 Tax=Lophiostoma macrostomum CBS 122681 TaxID=1314788 RepID=A0A6A6TLD5_9PLEO|nr:hypothetical protein K491DRAFT_675456 [Lophiostoma macrostomum CBS 122681]
MTNVEEFKRNVEETRTNVKEVKTNVEEVKTDMNEVAARIHDLQADVQALRDHQSINQLVIIGGALSQKLTQSGHWVRAESLVLVAWVAAKSAALNAWVMTKKIHLAATMISPLTEKAVTIAFMLAVLIGGIISYTTSSRIGTIGVLSTMIAVITYGGYMADRQAIWTQIDHTKAALRENLQQLKEFLLRLQTWAGATYICTLAWLRAATIDHTEPMQQLAKVFAVVLGIATIWSVIDWIIAGLCYSLVLLVLLVGVIFFSVQMATSPKPYYPRHYQPRHYHPRHYHPRHNHRHSQLTYFKH